MITPPTATLRVGERTLSVERYAPSRPLLLGDQVVLVHDGALAIFVVESLEADLCYLRVFEGRLRKTVHRGRILARLTTALPSRTDRATDPPPRPSSPTLPDGR